MHVVLAEQTLAQQMRERHQLAAEHNRAARLLSARRWEKRAAQAARRARAAQSAIL